MGAVKEHLELVAPLVQQRAAQATDPLLWCPAHAACQMPAVQALPAVQLKVDWVKKWVLRQAAGWPGALRGVDALLTVAKHYMKRQAAASCLAGEVH